jgi:hypothetical protein
MNQSAYTIYLKNFNDITCHILAIENCVKSLELQLQKEAIKKRKFFGVFYTPTPGLQDHDRVSIKMREIHQDLLNELPNFGDGPGAIAKRLRETGSTDIVGCSLKVNNPPATFLYIFLKMGMRSFQQNVKQGQFKDKPEFVRNTQESFDRLLPQLPFNDQDFEGGYSFSDVHQ